jgi:hypothetical protein
MPRGLQSRPIQLLSRQHLTPYAADIDIGATAIYVAVAAEQEPEPVRRFGTFTQGLLVLAHWLRQCGIRMVAEVCRPTPAT